MNGAANGEQRMTSGFRNSRLLPWPAVAAELERRTGLKVSPKCAFMHATNARKKLIAQLARDPQVMAVLNGEA